MPEQPYRKGNERMKVRVLSILTAGAFVLGAAGLMAPAAGASRSPQVTHKGTAKAAPHAPGVVLYNQNDNNAGIGIVSQNFEATFDIYDSQGADDFTTTGNGWKIKNVTVTGVYFNGYGPAVSETVYVYKDSGGLPGALSKSKTKVGADSGGSFSIGLGKKGIKLPVAGHFWVSVQANLDFGVGGEWGWETRTVQHGAAAAWQNPGNGFSTGCTTWGVLTTCIPAGEGPDFMFALSGKQL